MAQATIGALRVVLGLDSANFTKGLRSAQSRLKRIGKQMQSVGRSMALSITAPILLMGAGILKAAGDFESAMSGIRAVLNPTEKDFKRLRDAALELGRTTVFSATEAAKGMEVLAKNGLNATQILDGATEATLNFAAAAGGDLAGSAEVITDIMINFGVSASDLGDIVDNATGALLTSKLGFEDYVGAVGQAAGVAGAFGLSVSDMNTALSITTSSFASGTDAGTSFKGFLLRLAPSSKTAQKAIKKLGLEFFTATGEGKDLIGITQTLVDAFAGLSDEDTFEKLNTIFGTRTSRTAIRLIEATAEGVKNLAAEIAKISAADVAKARLDNFVGQVRLLKSALENLAITISEAGFLKWARDLAERLTELARTISKGNKSLLKWGTIAALAAAALGPLFIVIGLTISALGFLSPAIVAIAAPFALVGAAIGLAIINFIAWRDTFRDVFPEATKFIEDFTNAVITGFNALTDFLGIANRIQFTGLQQQIDGVLDQVNSLDATIESLTEARRKFIEGEKGAVSADLIPDINENLAADLVEREKLVDRMAVLQDRLFAAQNQEDPTLPKKKIITTGTGTGTGTGGPKTDILKGLLEEANAIEARIAVVGLSTAAEVAFLAVTRARNKAREEGIDLGKEENKLFNEQLEIFASDVGDAARRLEQSTALENIANNLQDEAIHLKNRIALVGLNTKEATEFVAITEAMNEAVRVGLELSPEEIEAIKERAVALGEAAEELRIKFEQENAILGIADDITGPFRDALKDGELSFKSFAKTLLDVGARLRDRLIDEIFDPIEDALIDALKGLGDSKGGGGDFFSSLVSAGVSALGGGAATTGGGGFTAPQGASLSAGAREHGGPVKAGQPYIVGEKRPELFVPDTDGVILPRVPSGKPSADDNVIDFNTGLAERIGKSAENIPSFAGGGSFTVGGSPGVDKNVVAFNASRGERVDITPQGKSSGDGVVVQIINNTPVQTREESATGDGGEQIRRFVIDAVGKATAQGEFDRQNQSRFGMSPRRMKR